MTEEVQTVQMCTAKYTRPLELFPADGLVVPIPCTFIEGHGANHSFFALEHEDAIALEELRARKRQEKEELAHQLPYEVQQILNGFDDGQLDPYIEIILARGHDRKRFLRGVPGFGRRSA